MRALGQGLLKPLAGNNARHMGCVIENIGTDLVSGFAHLPERVGIETETACNGDQFRSQSPGIGAEAIKVYRHAPGIVGHRMRLEPVKPCGTRLVVGHMPAHLSAEHHYPVAGLGCRHERIEIGKSARTHADLRIGRIEKSLDQVLGDRLDLACIRHAHFIFVTWITKARPVAERAAEHGGRAGVHHVGAGIKADRLAVEMPFVVIDECKKARLDRVEIVGRGKRGLDVADNLGTIGSEAMVCSWRARIWYPPQCRGFEAWQGLHIRMPDIVPACHPLAACVIERHDILPSDQEAIECPYRGHKILARLCCCKSVYHAVDRRVGDARIVTRAGRIARGASEIEVLLISW